jgi:branched-chain amino acid transport system substrate-binding protein
MRLIASLLFFISLLPLFSSNAASQAEPLIIGIDADFTAVAVEGGMAIKKGVELAVDEINARGGVLGRNLKIVAKDHRGNPARGLHNIESFAKDPNLLAVIGGVHTPVVLAEIDAIHKNDLLMLVPWAAGTPIIDNGFSPNNIFRVSVRDSEAASVMIDHAKQSGISRIALVLERTGWGRSNLTSLKQAAAEKGLSISSIHWINWQQKNFSDDISAIKSSDAEAILLVTNVPEGVVVLDEMAQQDIASMPVISHWGIASGQLAQKLATPIGQFNISVLQTFHFDKPRTQSAEQLLRAYHAKFGEVAPSAIKGATGLAHAYDLTHLIAAAAEKAATIKVEKLREALESLIDVEGAVKTYASPFTKDRHDALWSKDYFMTVFDEQGHLKTMD